jgi:tRNA (guanine-N7-)-methyltransferase
LILTGAELETRLAQRDDTERCEFEIGCGSGHFACAHASQNPQTLVIACELKGERCRATAERARRAGLANLAVIKDRGEDLLQRFPKESLDAVHIYFPDPWPKARHRRRRVLRWMNLVRMVECLRLGGQIRFVTDFHDYALQARMVAALHPQLETARTSDFDADALSRYGPRLQALGKSIDHLTATRVSTVAVAGGDLQLFELLSGSRC